MWRGRRGRRGLFGVGNVFDEIGEVAYFFKVSVDGSKTDISNIVCLLEGMHDHFSDGGCGDFGFSDGFDLSYEAACDLFDFFLSDGSFLQGDGDGVEEFVAVEGLPCAIIFDDLDVTKLDSFEGCESRATIFARSPSSYGGIFLSGS